MSKLGFSIVRGPLEGGGGEGLMGGVFSEEYVVRNIAPSADKSCSSGLNGSDPEQMSERQRMKTFPKFYRHLEYYFDYEPIYLQTYQTYKHVKVTRKSSTYPC